MHNDDDALPCLIHDGPPKLMIWPKVTLDVRGRHVTVDALARIGEQDPQWFTMEFGQSTPASQVRELALDMPCVHLTHRDVVHPNFMANMVARIQDALPRKAA